MHDYNGHPFSSLEPEILCRLVYVRSVECLTGGGASADAGQAAGSGGGAAAPGKAAGDGAAEAAGGEGSGGGSGGGGGETERRAAGGWGPLSMAGHTELPTCPVCLERLDEHISGVVTTVRTARRADTRADPQRAHAPWPQEPRAMLRAAPAGRARVLLAA